jgi:DNA polymerase-3 subunit epsilon
VKILYLDTETTGTDPSRNGIWQIAGAVEVDGVVKEEFNFLVAPFPADEIENEALRVGGRMREEIEKYEPPAAVHKKLLTIFSRYVDKFDKHDKFFMVAYNGGFDDDFLRAFWLKNGDKYYGSWIWYPVLDVAVLVAHRHRAARGTFVNFKQQTVADKLGIKIDGTAHDALYDVRVCRAVYRSLEPPCVA